LLFLSFFFSLPDLLDLPDLPDLVDAGLSLTGDAAVLSVFLRFEVFSGVGAAAAGAGGAGAALRFLPSS
jgi:hypothetical protein